MTKKPDDILAGFPAFNEVSGDGAVIRKVAEDYSLLRESNGKPIARLRTKRPLTALHGMLRAHPRS
jgi:hypothetical protein